MCTDFNNSFTVRTRTLWRIKGILWLPPHLYSVTALPSKTYTTANDAHVWLIDVNGPSATTKVTVMRLINNIQARLQCSMCSFVLRGFIWLQGASSWLHIMSWIIETLSAVLRDLGRPLPDFRSVDPQLWIFFSQTIRTCHRPSLVRKLFSLGVWPHFSLFVDLLSNSDRPSLFCPFKPSKTIKTI